MSKAPFPVILTGLKAMMSKYLPVSNSNQVNANDGK